MSIYYGVLETDGQTWGVWFPDIPGCVSGGDTSDEAIAEARSVLQTFIAMDLDRGMSEPVSRPKATLLGDADVRNALAAGSLLIAFTVEHSPARNLLKA